jgi:type IV secretory pathway TrbF-like protein
MDRWTATRKRLIVGLGCLILCAIMLGLWTYTPARNQVDAAVLEREVRGGLKVGSSLSAVDNFLRQHQIESSFNEPSRTIYAIVRGVNGSSLLVRADLTFQFHFDQSLTLT